MYKSAIGFVLSDFLNDIRDYIKSCRTGLGSSRRNNADYYKNIYFIDF